MYNPVINQELNGVIHDGVVIYEISVVDTVLNQSMNHFNSKEIDVLYTFWNGLSTTSYSRNAAYSASSFETSGGSKAEYLELLGGALNDGEFSQRGFTGTKYILED